VCVMSGFLTSSVKYYVLELAPNGELLSFIRQHKTLSMVCVMLLLLIVCWLTSPNRVVFPSTLLNLFLRLSIYILLGLFIAICTKQNINSNEIDITHTHTQSHLLTLHNRKPENLLLDENMHLKLTDFGTAKQIGTELRARSESFVGTAEYISPELLEQKVC
jgi:serine/threonine protein kinase